MIQRASLDVRVASGDALEVHEVTITERLSALFEVSLVVASQRDLDLDAIAGRAASLTIRRGAARRTWSGICRSIREEYRSIYAVTIAPTLWLAAQRPARRVFPKRPDVDTAVSLLAEWHVTPVTRLLQSHGDGRRAQRDESDFAFFSRILADRGIAFYFDAESRLVLTDTLEAREARAPIAIHDAEGEHITIVRTSRQIPAGEDRETLQRLARLDALDPVTSVVVEVDTSELDLAPGVITSIVEHHRAELREPLLVTESTLTAKQGEPLSIRCSLTPAATHRLPRSREGEELAIDHDDLTIDHDHTVAIGNDERRVTGHNLGIVVGVNRSSQVGFDDTIEVGNKHAVRIAGGTTAVMQHDRIELGTPGGAKITLEGSTISLSGTRVVAKTEEREGAVLVADKSKRD